MNDVWVFDAEGDSLEPTKLHCLVATKDGTNFIELTDEKEIAEFLRDKKRLVCHNLIRFDCPVFERLLGVDLSSVLKIDSLALSWYLYPKRGRSEHNLDAWGETFGIPKPKVEDWQGLTTEEYLHRCREDVKINWKLWKFQEKYLKELYGSFEKSEHLIRYLGFKMYCAHLQEHSKWKLDVEFTKKTLQELRNLFFSKKQELEEALPLVPDYRSKTPPKVMYKKDGSLSALGQKWIHLCNEHGVDPFDTEEIKVIHDYKQPNSNSTEQVKAWLFSLGWEPSEYKEEKDKTTGDIKHIPQVNLPFGKGLCHDIIRLKDEVEPKLEALESYYVLQHRIGILKGFLSSVDEEGFIKAGVAGLTNTLRFRHAEIVNLPKPGTNFGDGIRACLVSPNGKELCGSDMSSLEDRLKQHFIYPYDPDYVHEMMKEDFDPHLDLANMSGELSNQEVQAYKDGDKTNKKTRDIFKNGNYSFQYGAGPPKFSRTTGLDLSKAKEVHAAYWKRNWSVKAVANDQLTKTVGDQMWLWNPVSEVWYSLRYEKDIFSTLVQGTASFVFDLWLGLVLKKRPQLTGQFHDEFILCILEGYREQCSSLLNEAIEKTNEILDLNRRLDIDIQFGHRYSEIH